jgi:transcriptional regulator with XRE-family HTH domain
MNFGERVKTLRKEIGLSQEAIGSQGFVSTPGWIKVENGQRRASEKLIDKLVKWLVDERHVKAIAGKALREELLTLKYLASNAPFLRTLAQEYAKTLPGGTALLVTSPKVKARRGRPRQS